MVISMIRPARFTWTGAPTLTPRPQPRVFRTAIIIFKSPIQAVSNCSARILFQNRSFTVSGGIITAYTGIGGPVHMISPDQNQPGAITIALASSSCPADFQASPNNGGAYKAHGLHR